MLGPKKSCGVTLLAIGAFREAVAQLIGGRAQLMCYREPRNLAFMLGALGQNPSHKHRRSSAKWHRVLAHRAVGVQARRLLPVRGVPQRRPTETLGRYLTKGDCIRVRAVVLTGLGFIGFSPVRGELIPAPLEWAGAVAVQGVPAVLRVPVDSEGARSSGELINPLRVLAPQSAEEVKVFAKPAHLQHDKGARP